ncbi:MAG: glycosyltransferase family 2 protein [Bdellovibrionales bacterium]|nr:glycosyltransferase family 2 protein [Bdellovibrionales bacterium]
MDNRKLSIVVPIFNEASLIKQLVERLHRSVSQLTAHFEIILVNDGSTDASLEKMLEQKKEVEQLKIVELARNFGQTAALAAGIDHASGEIIVTMDGDLQHNPEEISKFIAKLDEGYDIVSGWREVRSDSFLLRRLPSLIANLVARLLSGIKLRDFGSTFKAYRASVVKQLDLFGELHRFVPVLAGRLGARIVEIPIEVQPRAAGKSNYNLLRTFGVFEDLIFLLFYSQYLTKPIRAFGKLFFVFFGCGFLIACALMGLWICGAIDNVLQRGGLLLFSVFLMIIGVQFLVTGILAELLSRIYLQTSSSKIYAVRAVHG